MSFTKIHAVDQGLFHNRGICYWMCEYMMRSDSSNPGAWAGSSRKTYGELKASAESFTAYVACANWGKAKQKDAQLGGYGQVTGALQGNSLYRIEVCIDTLAQPKTAPNHEMMCVTGKGSTVLLFDPNFGFFEFKGDTPAETNRAALERHLNDNNFYGKTSNRAHLFGYRKINAIKS